MDNLSKGFALMLVFILLTSLITVQLALAQTTESVFDHFDFDPIGPQVVGVPFNIMVTAKDQYNQTLTSDNKVNQLVNILIFQNNETSDYFLFTGTFVNGVWSHEITLSKGGSETYIVVRDGGGKTGISNWFYVDGPGALDHFDISPIGRQSAGVPFNITITAKDQNGQTVTSYNGVNTWTVTHLGHVTYEFYNRGPLDLLLMVSGAVK